VYTFVGWLAGIGTAARDGGGESNTFAAGSASLPYGERALIRRQFSILRHAVTTFITQGCPASRNVVFLLTTFLSDFFRNSLRILVYM